MGTPLITTSNSGGSFIVVKSTGQDVGDLLSNVSTIKSGCMFAACRVPMSGLSDGIQTNGTYQVTHMCPPPAVGTYRDIRLVYCNLQAVGQTETVGLNTITIKASVTMGLASGVIPVTFNGSRQVTIDPGGMVISDPIGEEPVANFALTSLTWVSVSGGQKWPVGLPSGTNDAFQNGSDTTLAGFSGSAVTGGVAPFGMYGPCAIIATPNIPQPSIALLGDSVINGIGGDATGTDVGFVPSGKSTVHGWAERALSYVRGGWVQLGCNGESSALWAVNQRLRNAIAKATCNWAWYQMGANDGANSLAQLQAFTIDVVRKYHNMGLKIAVGTIIPRTTSSDGWTTLVNQTSAWPAAVRTGYNDWVRAGGTGADTFIECATPVESSFNSGLWKITGLTVDGVHPNAAGSAAIAASLNVSRFT